MTYAVRLLEQAIAIVERNNLRDTQTTRWLAAARAFIAPPDAERQKLIEAARDAYGSDDLEIDDEAQLSSCDEGNWVAAWVWLPADCCENCGQPLEECRCEVETDV